MPEFILETGTTETHKTFDALPDIARGYLEAAFFCGVSWDDPDGSGDHIDGLGLGNLDPDAMAGLVAEACRFWIDNAETLERATESGAYDLEQAGHDLWFNRNGHGVGYWCREELDSDIQDALDKAARGAGESDLWALPVDLETGEPLPGYHVAHDTETDAEPDPDDAEAWRVFQMMESEPLTDAEHIALAVLEGEPVAEPLPDVGSRYGAPMGRTSYKLDPDAGDMTARRVTLDPGGYDAGGAYWGTGTPLWCVTDADGSPAYVRAAGKADAIREVAQC